MPLAASSFLAFPTPVLSDALDSLGRPGAVGGWLALNVKGKIAGRVVTLRLEPAGDKTPPVHLGVAAIHAAQCGDIIVVANRGRTEAAAWGGLLSLAALKVGVAAVIIDGLLRDVDEVQKLALPVLARGFTPLSARRRFAEAKTNSRVEVAGITVEPGDLAVIDGSGAVLVPRAMTRKVLEAASRIAAFEAGFENEIAAGKNPQEVLDKRYEQLTGE